MTLFEPGQLNEVAVLAAALYCGIAIGVLYDLFSLIRLPFKSPWVAGALDAAFYGVAMIFAAITMLYANCGTFRLYIYLTIGGGILLYRRYPGRLIHMVTAKFTKKQLHRKLR